MTWRSKTVGLVGVIAVVAAGYGYARSVTSRHHDEQIRREMHAKAETLKEEIDRKFPAGTDRPRFMEFAEHHWPRGLTEARSGDYYISVGQVPSRVWYCGPFDVGVVASFRNDRLTGTVVSTWGFFNCP